MSMQTTRHSSSCDKYLADAGPYLLRSSQEALWREDHRRRHYCRINFEKKKGLAGPFIWYGHRM